MYNQNTKRKIHSDSLNGDWGRVYPYVGRNNKKPLKKKKKSLFLAFLSLVLFSSLFSLCSYINYDKFLAPIYVNRFLNRNLNFDYSKYISPTKNYIHNLNFMGKNLLADIPSSGREKIYKIVSSGEIYDLKYEISSICSKYKNLHPGVFVFDYETGKTVKINSDEEFSAASIIKIPVLLALLNHSKNLENEGFNPVNLQSKRTFLEAHRSEGSGDMQYSQSGVDYSLDYLAKIMIRKSDNSATNMLIEEVGGINGMNSILRYWGFKNTKIGNWLPDLEGSNVTTPEDIATLLYNLDNKAFLPHKYSSKAVEYMSKVENRTLIKSQIPDSAILIHKTGDIGKMLGDAGLIYTPDGRKFILVVMVKRPHNDYSARTLIQEISHSVYNKFSNNK